jgi:hypothetical protein
MKHYLSTFAVGLILYAAPGYSQTAQLDQTSPRQAATNAAPNVPGFSASSDAPPLSYCMMELQKPNLKGLKPAEEWSSGCERRVDAYCKTHDTGDPDDTPSNRERDHMLSACSNAQPLSAGACKKAFRDLCPALNAWQATNP